VSLAGVAERFVTREAATADPDGFASLFALLALTATVRLTWSFSAFTVLIYYAIPTSPLCTCRANRDGIRAALRRRAVWTIGLAMIVAGLLWRALAGHL
jgi:hypothetical protein